MSFGPFSLMLGGNLGLTCSSTSLRENDCEVSLRLNDSKVC